jgi:GDPmannose 4,6-dehydratase
MNQQQKDLVHLYNPEIEVQILDSSDVSEIVALLKKVLPEKIFHLAAQSSVASSWNDSENTLKTNVFNTLNWLNALKELKMFTTRFYHASSSEMFGLPKTFPQSEKSLLHPRSPYGVSKVAAHHLVVNYRESYGQFASSGILFNHESPLRKLSFVTRKIANGVASISQGKSNSIVLGDISISRDWGWAPDYVDGMIKILNHREADDFVLATGHSHTLQDFIVEAFKVIGITDWQAYIKTDQSLKRPAEVTSVVGDSSKAKLDLGWQAETTFEEMIQKMVEHELQSQNVSGSLNHWNDF